MVVPGSPTLTFCFLSDVLYNNEIHCVDIFPHFKANYIKK